MKGRVFLADCREGKVGRGDSLGLSGMDNSGGLEAVAVLCYVAPALGDVGQENAALYM